MQLNFRLTTLKDLSDAFCGYDINFQSKQIKLGEISTYLRYINVVFEIQKSED